MHDNLTTILQQHHNNIPKPAASPKQQRALVVHNKTTIMPNKHDLVSNRMIFAQNKSVFCAKQAFVIHDKTVFVVPSVV